MKRRNQGSIIQITLFALFAFLIMLQWFPSYASAAEEANRIHTFSLTNDPFIDSQWYIDNKGEYSNMKEIMVRQTKSTENVDMDVAEAWSAMEESGVPEREVIVAVIDTGVDYQHPDLAANIWINAGEIPGDGIDNDQNGYIDDVNGWDFYNNDATVGHYKYSDEKKAYIADPNDNDNHGTHVAGIIAAVANNNTGIAGIASNINIKIMPLKINGGKSGDGDIQNALDAIKYAQRMGADICNMSWGTRTYSKELEQAMKESDMLFVAAAGNTGDNNDEIPVYPASLALDNVISVTFINAYGGMTGYSNFGANSIDLAAPGSDIYSTIVGGYDTMSGSSMAAPQVTAVAALLYAFDDHLYAANVKSLITSSIKTLEYLDGVTIYGGIPSAYEAIMEAGSLQKDNDAPVMSFSTVFNKNEMTVPVQVEDIGASQVRVVKYIYGVKSVEDFQNGINGTSVKNNQVNLSRAGSYTFYAADYAGNEIAQVYEVVDDKTSPSLTTTFKVASNYKTRAVTVRVSDKQSGIKRVEYMAGMKTAKEFLPSDSGTEITVKDGMAKFKVKKDGIYTVFAMDNRGNVTVKPMIIKTIKSTEFAFETTTKELSPGDQFVLYSVIKPIGSTDQITYVSSNEKIATVSSTGKVTALTAGKVSIKATTASGLTATCEIIVRRST